MIAYYCRAESRAALDSATVEGGPVWGTWVDFVNGAAPATCAVVVVTSTLESERVATDLVAHGGLPELLPTILVAPIDAAVLGALGSLRYDSLIPVDRAIEIASETKRLQVQSTRTLAAGAILRTGDVTEVCRAAVVRVLISERPVSFPRDLAQSLCIPLHRLRRSWRRGMHPGSGMRLTEFCRWGRALREFDFLREGHSVADVALRMNVDESTVYRDLRRSGISRTNLPTPAGVLMEFLAEINL